ncbi:MAG: M56 family metallopeptidase [Asticcacaulis sp.]|uniref:M56 family metallopeptidase n=1 Tax=Asticcacaulis sp. TaxID=1872648 RepID=UPI0039E413D8
MNPHMEALGFTLVHFCWQAALIAAAYKLAEMAWPNLKPQARYSLGLAALLAMTLVAVATFLYEEIRLFQLAPAVAAAPVPVAVGENPAFSLSNWLPWLDAVWLIGVIALTFRMITSLCQVHGLKKHAQAAPIAVQDRFSAALRRFGLTGKVQVRLHPAISGPFVVGAFRAVVYLPLSAVTALSPAQLDAVLSHELEHIRRADYLWNLVQNLIETLFFYHPAVWWIGAKLREQRELCCDDAAINTCEDPITYATALLNLEEQRRGMPGNLAMALNGQGRHELLSRISRILGEAPDSRLKVRPVAFVLLPAMLLTLTAFAAAPVTEAAGKICPQDTAKKATLVLASLQEAIIGKPASDKTPGDTTVSPAEITVPDDQIEWESQSAADTIDPDAIAAEARAEAMKAKADIANAKNIDIDPQALAAEARDDAMKTKAEMERQGIAHSIDPDAIAAQVLAETQRAKADAARVALASIEPDAIAAEARAAAVAAKAQYQAHYKDYQAQKEFYKAQHEAYKAQKDAYKGMYKADLKRPKAPLPPLSPLPPVPPLETPAPLADPAAPVPPAAPLAPLAPLAAVSADWHIETRTAPNGKAVAVITAPKGKDNTLAMVTLDQLPNATPTAIPSPDPRTDVQINVRTRIKVKTDPQVRVTVDTEH